MQAMLLAAGFGTRLRPYSLIRPKPLFPLLNRPLLLILLDQARGAGCGQIIVNGHHLSLQVRQAVRDFPAVRFQHEPEILGTGGSLRRALPFFSGEPVLVINGDICHDIDLAALYRHHLQSGNPVTMALHDYPRFNSVAVDGERIRDFPSGPAGSGNMLAYTGIQVIEPRIIRRIPPDRFFHIIDLYRTMISEGEKIGFMRVDGCLWRDIGTPEDYLQLHEELLTGQTNHSLPLSLPEGSWLISPGARAGKEVTLAGWGCIGRAAVGSNVFLRNCVVWDQAEIKSGASMENTIITPPLNEILKS